MSKKDITFAFMASTNTAADALMLAASIRKFGGKYADSPIIIPVPQTHQPTPTLRNEFEKLKTELAPFEIDQQTIEFPFAAKVLAAAKAEELCLGKCENLVWMDSDSLLIQQPDEMLLPPGKTLAYRPVDHTLIASSWKDEIDEFWKLIYADCAVSTQNIFAMTGSVDQNRMRAYFNAGMLVVDPAAEILGKWSEKFVSLFQEDKYKAFYEQKVLYAIFIHQAVLAGVILNSLEREKLHELPHIVNYPLHMHKDYPAGRKARTLQDLISARHDTFFKEENWREQITIREPFKSWLEDQLTIRSERIQQK